MMRTTGRRLVGEFVGTALLLATIVGSGITASLGNAEGSLLHHAVAIGGVLAVLIVVLAPVSGAHFNPLVTVAAAVTGSLPSRLAAPYLAAQAVGAVAGVAIGNVMFGHPPLVLAEVERVGAHLAVSEFLATFGLLVVIFGLVHNLPRVVPLAVGAYIAGAILFTSSAAFANPAVTLARLWTPTATGIAPAGVPTFLVGQVAGAGAAMVLLRWLLPNPAREAASEPNVVEVTQW